MQPANSDVIQQLSTLLNDLKVESEKTADDILTLWISREHLIAVSDALRFRLSNPFTFLYDLTAIDETERQTKVHPCRKDFTVVLVLRSYQRNLDLRLKVALSATDKSVPSKGDAK